MMIMVCIVENVGDGCIIDFINILNFFGEIDKGDVM